MRSTHWVRDGRLYAGLIALLIVQSGCATKRYKPCTEGGEPVRDSSAPTFRGTKRCRQVKDPSTGQFVNDGKYYEGYESDRIAIEGEYKKGKKHGRWVEYDDNRNKVSDRYYEDGKLIERP